MAESSPSLTTQRVSLLADVPVSTLHYWVKVGLVAPELLGPAGKRSPLLWSARDLVVVRAIKALREAGCPLQQVRQVQSHVRRAWNRDLANLVLYWEGDVIAVDEYGNVLQLLGDHPDQLLLHLIAVPLAPWAEAANRAANENRRPVQEIKARRAARPERSATPTVRLQRQAE